MKEISDSLDFLEQVLCHTFPSLCSTFQYFKDRRTSFFFSFWPPDILTCDCIVLCFDWTGESPLMTCLCVQTVRTQIWFSCEVQQSRKAGHHTHTQHWSFRGKKGRCFHPSVVGQVRPDTCRRLRALWGQEEVEERSSRGAQELAGWETRKWGERDDTLFWPRVLWLRPDLLHLHLFP